MPVFNAENYIRFSIESILSQTHKNFEFLVIDDGSTDNSKKIIESIEDERLIYKKKNHTGLSDTLNYGIKLSKSELIFRMDSDDYSQPNRIELQIKFMNENPEISLCGSFMYIINNNNKIISKKKLPENDKFIKKTIMHNSNIMHPTFCFKKSDIIEAGCYRDQFTYAQDYDLILRLITNNCKFANLPEYLLLYRQSNMTDIKKIYTQMKFTRIARKLYFDRKNKFYESKRNINLIKDFEKLNLITVIVFKLFILLNNKRISKKFPKILWILLSYFISFFNYELFVSLINDFIYYYKMKHDENRKYYK